jgi:hypothetical protein
VALGEQLGEDQCVVTTLLRHDILHLTATAVEMLIFPDNSTHDETVDHQQVFQRQLMQLVQLADRCAPEAS